MIYSIKNPRYLQLVSDNGQFVLGCNQDWYPATWQRRAGCGPTTAANLLIYHQRSGRFAVRDRLETTSDALDLMQRVWHHVKPTAMGVHTPGIFQQGLKGLFSEMTEELHGLQINLEPVSLLIPRRHVLRPRQSEVIAFIRQGLMADSPVAFLNLHNGSIRRLDRWHWVTITGLDDTDESQVMIEICDNLQQFKISLTEWFYSTTLGGGFVYLKSGS